MSSNRIVGIILLVAGAVLLLFTYQGASSVVDRMKELFTGRTTDRTMVFLIVGLVSVIAGLIATIAPGRRLGGAT